MSSAPKNVINLAARNGGAIKKHETVSGIAPTKTVGEDYGVKPSRLSGYMELFKLRVTSMVVLSAWTGYYLSARTNGAPTLSWKLLAVLAGIALVSSGAGALNQAIERREDGMMSRTRLRPIPAGAITGAHATIIALTSAAWGILLLCLAANLLTGALALATAAAYCLVYTPLKKISPVSTFIGAFPGAMPPLLGWTAIAGKITWEAGALFALLFFWQFPHFLAIAWLYREDYERAGIRMRPVIDQTGRATIFEIVAYGLALIPVSTLPYFLGMAGKAYLATAVIAGVVYLAFGVRLGMLRLPPSDAFTKKHARHLLKASVVYLPVVLAAMMMDFIARR